MTECRSWVSAGVGLRMISAALVFGLIGCGTEAEPAPEEVAPEEPEVDFIQEAVWSPRSDRLLATWDQGGRYRLFGIIAPDTAASAYEPSAGLRLSDGPDTFGSWAPDGLWIAFGSTRDGQGEIYRMRPDGTGTERLTDDPGEDTEPAYSPDGAQIAFISDRTDGSPRLHIMNADGTDVRMVGSPPGSVHHGPEWAPDGRRITLSVTMEDGEFVHLTSPVGGWGRVRRGSMPSWHPDSDQIFFSLRDTVYVVRTSVNSRRPVTPGFAPRPAPNGRWLAFVRGEFPLSVLWAMNMETGEEQRITR